MKAPYSTFAIFIAENSEASGQTDDRTLDVWRSDHGEAS
jgi:hypothetical protein